MATPTAVNDQITDSVTQANVAVMADSPAVALSHLYQTLAHATGLSFQNAVTAQQQLNIAAQAATIQGVNLLYSLDTAASAVATSKTNMSDLPGVLTALMAASKVK